MDTVHDRPWMGQQCQAAGGTWQPVPCGSSSSRFSQDLEQIQHMQRELAELTALLDVQAGSSSSSSGRLLNQQQQQQQHEIEALAAAAAAADVDPPSIGSAGSDSAAAAAGACMVPFHGVTGPSAAVTKPGLQFESLPSTPSVAAAAATAVKVEPAAVIIAAAAGSSDLVPMDQTVDEVCHFVYDNHMACQQQQHEQQHKMIAASDTWTRQHIESSHRVQQQQQQQQVIKQQQQKKLPRQQQNYVDLLQQQQTQQIGLLVQQDLLRMQPVQQSDSATQLFKGRAALPRTVSTDRTSPDREFRAIVAPRRHRAVVRDPRTGARQCSNCGVDSLTYNSYWRRDPADPTRELCNACGLYKVKYGFDRPRDPSMRYHTGRTRELEAVKLQMAAQRGNSLPASGQLPQPPISSNNSSSSSCELLMVDNSNNLSPEASIMQLPAAADTSDCKRIVSLPSAPSSLSSSPPPPAVAITHPPSVLPPPAAAAAEAADHCSLPPPRKRRRQQQSNFSERQCANCKTIESSYWRKDLQVPTRKLCNPCGLYKAKHGVDRPSVLWPSKLLGDRERRRLDHSADGVMQALRAYVSTPHTPLRPRGWGAPTPAYMQTAVPVPAVPVVAVQPVHLLVEAPVVPHQQQLPHHQQQHLVPAEFIASGPPQVALAAAGMGVSGSSTAKAVPAKPVAAALPAVPAVLVPAVAAAAAMHMRSSSPGWQNMPTAAGGVVTSAAAENHLDLLEPGQWESAGTSDSDGQTSDSECAADGNAVTGKDGWAATEAAAGVQQFLQRWVSQNAS